MQRIPGAARAGAHRFRFKGMAVWLVLALAAAPVSAQAWTPWGAIARLFSGGGAVRQGDGAAALRAVCLQANDKVLQAFGADHGFLTDPAARLDIASVFAGSGSLALAFGGGNSSGDLQRELALAAEAAMPRVHALLAGEIARQDFSDPLAVLRSEPGTATRILAVRWQSAVQDVFLTRMGTSLETSAAWARTAAALDRVGPGRMSRATQRALLETASESAAQTVFRRMAETEVALRSNPDQVLSPKARTVLRRLAHQAAPRGS